MQHHLIQICSSKVALSDCGSVAAFQSWLVAPLKYRRSWSKPRRFRAQRITARLSAVAEDENTGDARGTSGISTLTAPWHHQGYETTQPPEPLLKALLQRDCTANVPVEREMFAEAPCSVRLQLHFARFPRHATPFQPVPRHDTLLSSPCSHLTQ